MALSKNGKIVGGIVLGIFALAALGKLGEASRVANMSGAELREYYIARNTDTCSSRSESELRAASMLNSQQAPQLRLACHCLVTHLLAGKSDDELREFVFDDNTPGLEAAQAQCLRERQAGPKT